MVKKGYIVGKFIILFSIVIIVVAVVAFNYISYTSNKSEVKRYNLEFEKVNKISTKFSVFSAPAPLPYHREPTHLPRRFSPGNEKKGLFDIVIGDKTNTNDV